MADDVVTVVLDGAPNLDDFASALSRLRDLLDTAAKEVWDGARIEWSIVSLDAGSASIGLRGLPPEGSQLEVVERVVTRTEAIAAALGDC